MNINKYITDNYNRLKAIASKTLSGYTDDIYHDTICRVLELFRDKEVDDEMTTYIVSAIRNNVNRQKFYAYNGRRVDKFDNLVNMIGDKEMTSKFDFDNIMDSVGRKFGDDTKQIVLLFLEGYSVQEIQDIYNINNFYYILRKVKKYIQNEYSGQV